ncbi:GTPase IMAP family member 8-like [Salminus brasiliensis]|uniref:GTPase IMAP family member 8-like n=1 Tax=Salminus brasiliensis TaxID=930266 RepID=UPI003B832820
MDLRAVVFGGKFSGKSSLINAVFGKALLQTQKRTAHCKKLQGNVCGRDLTLVDTPGWWKHFPLRDTANFLKRELIQGVSLCHPGPHAVVLVIEVDIPFTEKHRKAAEDHLGLIGGQIWAYGLVVFTRSHTLRDRSIEEHIVNEGKALQWVIEKCGNRYCVFDNTVLNNTSQVKHLLEQIEKIVQRNSGGYFQIEAKILGEAAEWKNTVMTKAKSRELKLQNKRTDLNKNELRITLLGWVIAGKSSAGNTILNQSVFVTGQSTRTCEKREGEVDGRPVTVLDTPSWFKYFPSQYTPAWIKSEILKSQASTSPHCILLVIPGDTSFKEEQRKVIEENMSFLGEQVWRHTIVLFTWGDILGDMTIEEHIESEGEALQWVIEKCGNRYHVFNNEERENRVQVTELLQKIDEMVARNCFFRPSTEVFGRIPAPQEVETQSGACDADSDLQDIVQLVDEEWRRRDKDLLKRVSEVKKEIKAKFLRSDISLDVHSNLNERKDHSKKLVSHTEEPLKGISEVKTLSTRDSSMDFPPQFQDKEKRPLKLKDNIKELLDWEWSRREEALMGRVMEMLTELRYVNKSGSNTEAEDHSEKQESLTEEKATFPKSDSSMDFPPQFQDEENRLLKLKDHIKELLDQEWSRRDEALLGRVLEMLSKLSDAQSEPTEQEKERAREKVTDWFQRQSDGYGSAGGSNQTDT